MTGRLPFRSVDKITLDREVFKALASDTRLDILKALDVRQKTVTELAKELGLNKATVFEHLEKLAAVDLIQKLEDERKWVYWQLTWKGRRLLHPEKITLALLLSSAFGTLLAAAAAFWMWARSGVARMTGAEAAHDPLADGSAYKGYDTEGAASSQSSEPASSPPMSMRADEVPPPDPAPVPADAVASDPVLLAVAVVMGLVFLALAAYAAYYWRKRRARAAPPGDAPPA